VFTPSGSLLWNEQAVLKAHGGTLTQQTGLSGNTAIVSGYKDGRAAIYVFRNANGMWSQVAVLTATGPASSDGLNGGIFISGNLILAGSPDRYWHEGAVYEFTETASGTWSQTGLIAGTHRNIGFGAGLNGVGNTVSFATTPAFSQAVHRQVLVYDVSSGSPLLTGTFLPWGTRKSQLSGYVSSPTGLVLTKTHSSKGPAYELVAYYNGMWNEVLTLQPRFPSGVTAYTPLAVTATTGLVGGHGSVVVYGP
jgi:hypothetical protein